MAEKKRHHASSAMKMEKYEKNEGKKGGSNKVSLDYSSKAGKASELNGFPNQSFVAHWGSSPSWPGDRYPNGIDDIDGIEEMMHKMIKKQASDRLY